MVKYPIDRASFRDIREEGLVYVDKTAYVDKLSQFGKYYFLARPRRFGKSLLLDTLDQYFRGDKALFEGLEICKLQPSDLEVYPVVRLNLSGSAFDDPDDVARLIDRGETLCCSICFRFPKTLSYRDRFLKSNSFNQLLPHREVRGSEKELFNKGVSFHNVHPTKIRKKVSEESLFHFLIGVSLFKNRNI